MNSFINILTLFVTFPLLALTIYSGFDISIDSLGMTGSQIPYTKELFIIFGFLILLIQLRRSYRRWMALFIVNKLNQFKWNEKVSTDRKSRVLTYNLLESSVMIALGIGIYVINPTALLPVFVFLFFAFDSIVFSIFGKDKFRVGLSSKAIFVGDREIILIYFTGLRKIAIQQQTIYFDYINDLQLTFPLDCIEKGKQESFFNTLETVIDKDRVFLNNIHQKK
jgi:hypothetical protein